MTYTINGKEWTEDEINNGITEIRIARFDMNSEYNQFMAKAMRFKTICYTRNPSDTDAIIDKCWDELMKLTETFDDGIADGLCTRWEYLMDYVKCTKLVAACICYIEMQEET
jgi:hypothetical protein